MQFSKPLAAALLIAFPTLGHADAHNVCSNLSITKDGDMQKALDCIGDLSERMVQQNNKIIELEARLPQDAILLSTTRCEDFGWKKLPEALGRTVIGAGSPATVRPAEEYVFFTRLDADGNEIQIKLRPYAGDPYRPLEAGGAESVVLKPSEMPKHAHIPTSTAGAVTSVLTRLAEPIKTEDYRVYDIGKNGSSQKFALAFAAEGEAGGNEAHDNMPPYIALYFCKKD